MRKTLVSWGASVSVMVLVAAAMAGTVAPARAAVPKTIVSLTFDDGNADQFAASQVLKAHGMVGTFFITTSWIGSPSWLTQANLRTMAADGNEIGGHTVTHPDLPTVSTSTATAEVCNGRNTLIGWGFNVTSFAYPFASENSAVERIVKNCGYTSARNLGDIRSPRSCSSCPYAETIPPSNAYNTAALDEVDSSWTLKNLQDAVTNAETHNGGWVQLTFHHIAVGTDPSLTISPTLFEQFVTWLAARTATGTTSVQTVSQALGNVQPPPAPTAPAVPLGVSATAGNATATVSWSAPNNGGSAISSYTVTPYVGTAAQTPVQVTGAPPAVTTVVPGLANGTAYTFRVTATNAVGTSPASAASSTVTPGAAAPPKIANGGFESALTSWIAGGVSAPKAAARAHSGTGSALLGVVSGKEPQGNSTLSQTITVPATGTTTLSFWYQPHTTDGSCGGSRTCRRDWMEGQIRNSSGSTLKTLFKLNSNSGNWTRITADLTALRGQTVTLWFNVRLDGAVPADNTWMYLDDVTMTNG